MKIGVIGANGFIGQAICEALSHCYSNVIQITRENYNEATHIYYNILINANGNSKKFWAIQNPEEDYIKSVKSVNDSLKDFKFKKYILISSVDALNPSNIYGQHKLMGEKKVQESCKEFMILRCCAVIGKSMKKGVVKDIFLGNKVFLTPDSKLYFIDAATVGIIVTQMVYQDITTNSTHTLFGESSITVERIGEVLGKKINYEANLEKQVYDLPERDFEDIKAFCPMQFSESYIWSLKAIWEGKV